MGISPDERWRNMVAAAGVAASLESSWGAASLESSWAQRCAAAAATL